MDGADAANGSHPSPLLSVKKKEKRKKRRKEVATGDALFLFPQRQPSRLEGKLLSRRRRGSSVL